MSNAPDIQSQIALVMGIAVVVERLLEAFWIVVKFLLSQGLSFDFKDLDNRKHHTYLKYKKFKEFASIIIGVSMGVGKFKLN